MNECKICRNSQNNTLHVAREMMFGLRDEFRYLECSKCGCVQLCDIPSDMAKYYPENYYSLRQNSWLKTFLRHQWASYAYDGFNPIGWLVSKRFSPYREMYAIRRAGIGEDARILDVGGGTGQLLLDLSHLGFKYLTGADPYIERDLTYNGGIRVFKKEVFELQEVFDVIMLHHSFEHMADPAEVMRQLARLLAPKGFILIRIPIAGSFAWKHYDVNWMHLDAPRHLFLHTPATIKLLAENAGLRLDSMFYDGDESQFWGSEQYKMDIPMQDAHSYAKNRSLFTRQQMQEFTARAQQNNKDGVGDLGCFHLRKKDE